MRPSELFNGGLAEFLFDLDVAADAGAQEREEAEEGESEARFRREARDMLSRGGG